MESVEARVAALELMVVSLKKAQQEPLLALIDWASKESFNELGRTRGKLLALEAVVRALVPACDSVVLARALAQAEADLLMLRLPERSMPGAIEGLAETAAALRRALTG